MIGGGRPLNVNFALSELSLGAAAVLISAFRKFDEYSYLHRNYYSGMKSLTMYINWTNWGVWMHYTQMLF